MLCMYVMYVCYGDKTCMRSVLNYKNYNKDILIGLLHAKLAESLFDVENDPNVKWDIFY